MRWLFLISLFSLFLAEPNVQAGSNARFHLQGRVEKKIRAQTRVNAHGKNQYQFSTNSDTPITLTAIEAGEDTERNPASEEKQILFKKILGGPNGSKSFDLPRLRSGSRSSRDIIITITPE